MAEASTGYPVRLDVDFPDRSLDRLTTFFRLLTIIPIMVIVILLGGDVLKSLGAVGGGLIVAPTLLMILFRQKYPRWWFDWNVASTKFGYRVNAYLGLLRDEYPSTDEEQAVHIEIPYPDVKEELNRWLPLVKWFLAIPHYIFLFVLGIS